VGTLSLLAKLDLIFKIDSSVSENMRNQILTMYGKHVSSKADISIIQTQKFTNKPNTCLIVPSALWFGCQGRNKLATKGIIKDKPFTFRLNYSCHSSYSENLLLKKTLQAEKMILLNSSRVNLKCLN
jgi:hypothetical protein